jgi:hypothetical protein
MFSYHQNALSSMDKGYTTSVSTADGRLSSWQQPIPRKPLHIENIFEYTTIYLTQIGCHGSKNVVSLRLADPTFPLEKGTIEASPRQATGNAFAYPVHLRDTYFAKKGRNEAMGMVRFKLDGISAFRGKSQNGDGRHFCVSCASQTFKGQTIIPFLDDQLHAVLSEFGKDLGAMLSCDRCGEILDTYYPETFWGKQKEPGEEARKSLLFKKF